MLQFSEIKQTTHAQINRVPPHTSWVVLGMIGLLLFLSGCNTQNPMGTSMSGSNSTSTARQSQPSPVQQSRHVQINLSIVINQPGMQKDWPAFSPSNLVVPANSIVTVTLRDDDLGDTLMPGNSPFTTVQGTLSNTAASDGMSYASLGFDKIAHTFSIPELQLNVPLAGDAPNGASYNTTTFTFLTGQAGTYTFRCYDPCGTGMMGMMGPMVTQGYMVGTLTVQ